MGVPRVLTFNFHEPYLCLMAKAGIPLDVGLYPSGHDMHRVWHSLYRPVPAGVSFLPYEEWQGRIASNHYDVIIAQNESNALDVAKVPCGKLIVCHNRRSFLNTTVTITQGLDPVAAFNKLLLYLGDKFEFVFISETKRADYGVAGRVILPGIDLADYGGYTGEEPVILRVGNTMRQRNLMFDVDFQEAACAGLPSRVLGANPEIAGAAPAPSWDALRAHYRNARCLLHVTREEYEDGYNLAMLEAMATGMPVVSLANNTSPLTDGVDGFVSADAAVLNARLRELLDDRELARALGARARETVAAKFPMEAFCEKWREAIYTAAERSTRRAWHAAKAASPPSNAPHVLLHYIASPLTTGRYFDTAAQGLARVTTTGFRVPEAVFQLWGFEGPPPAYAAQDIPLELDSPASEILRGLEGAPLPDLYLWVDSGQERVAPDTRALPMPKVAYLIDTHVTPQLRLEMARHFDLVFLAQRAQVEAFKAAGIAQARWLPLACSPELHAVPEAERHFDFAYVGSFNAEEHDRRRTLLGALAEEFPDSFVGRAWPEDMARIYAQSKIVVNACFNRDVNMRVFEAMASGALLITDEAEGLEELFTAGEHLVVYRDDTELAGLVQHYLEHPEERERIARAGQALVLREHTYAKRLEEIFRQTEAVFGPLTRPQDPAEKENKAYYQCPRRELEPFVPIHTRRLLDVGCGQGLLASTLKRERRLEEASGIEIIESAWREARQVLDTCLLGSIEEMELPFPEEHFDCIICADVLEHLVEPSEALRKLGRVLAPDGSIVISIPNIRYHEVVRMLAAGAWSYMEAGIMDSTHLRFFCGPDLYTLVEDAGLEVAALQPLSMLDAHRLPFNEDGTLSVGTVRYLKPSAEDWEGLRVYQYCVIVRKPGVDRLARARTALEAGDYDAATALAFNATGVDAVEQRALIAKALAKSGQMAQAEEIYADLLRERNDANLRAEYGTLLLAMGRLAEARPLLTTAMAEIEDADRVEAALGLLDLSEGDLASAFERLLRAAAASTGHVGLWVHLVPLARELGRGAEILDTLTEHAEFYSGNVELNLALCELMIEHGQHEEARGRLEVLLIFEPEHAGALALLERCGP